MLEPARKRVLWVGGGRSREEIRPFFALLGPTGCQRLRAVAMDMNAAYEEEVHAHCPQAAIVYDLFHVVARDAGYFFLKIMDAFPGNPDVTG